MSTQLAILPRPNVMIGLTHQSDGRMILKDRKTLKIGIGYPRGRASEVYVNADGKWIVRTGKKGNDGKFIFEAMPPMDTRQEAEIAFRKAWKASDVCNYPRKVGFFQFTKPVMGEDGVEIYVPDFNAIEAHSFADKDKPGPPTEIDIVFLDDEPYSGGFKMWAASELKCSGDGENALRVLSLASTPEEKELAKISAAAGTKTFPIVGGCWSGNCPYSKEGKDARGNPTPAPCKPGAEIKFQVSRNIRVGGTAFFHTSSFRTIPQIFSSIERIKRLTGGHLAGIPLKLVVGSHKTNHNNKPAIQNNVAIEFRAEDMEHLRKNLIEQAWKFRQAAGIPAPTSLLAAREIVDTDGPFVESMPDEDEDDGGYGGAEDSADDDFDAPDPTPIPVAATATQLRQQEVARKLQEAREKTPAMIATAAASVAAGELPTAARVPWTSQAGMTSLFHTVKERVGDEAFQRLQTKYDVMMGTLAWDDPKAYAFYLELKATKGDEEPF